ncbi:molybdenum cofactor guanylyltransferase MobA [Limoniibacter endophyticus]|uniref:Molybdenum cofactor guanylyltransferase n=1 Tax=Limoniibacter endophyticus TaxID=1565040 RepID=A0A8J3DIU9_9HYPH|nr:molybdenum cofactor guanylyltransferase MobA [Limoniibacter endophyticus]GHC75846.1 molybdenum cofactor guanylyltransferase [Limoniibacter endophyticus]
MAPRAGGIVLAGGLSRRMGAHKSGVLLHGKSLLAHVVDRISPQVKKIAISRAHNELAQFADSIPHLDDGDFPGQGPLAGILAGLKWARQSGLDALLCVPVDTPFLPGDLAKQLRKKEAAIVVAASNSRIHPTVSLWSVDRASILETHLRQTNDRSVRTFLHTQNYEVCEYPSPSSGVDPFFNINTPDDLEKAHIYAR